MFALILLKGLESNKIAVFERKTCHGLPDKLNDMKSTVLAGPYEQRENKTFDTEYFTVHIFISDKLSSSPPQSSPLRTFWSENRWQKKHIGSIFFFKKVVLKDCQINTGHYWIQGDWSAMGASSSLTTAQFSGWRCPILWDIPDPSLLGYESLKYLQITYLFASQLNGKLEINGYIRITFQGFMLW